MKRTAWLAVVVTVFVAGALLFLLERDAVQYNSVTPVSDRIQFYRLYADLAKAVLVGFGAALLGILIPAVFAEARFGFERLKDSRTAYSEAKTSIEYLPLRLCTLDLKAAAALVQRAHVRKHEAELYPELKLHLKYRGIDRTPEQWGDEIYDRLFTLRTLLEANAAAWDSLSPDARLALVRTVLAPPCRELLVVGARTAVDELDRFERSQVTIES